MPSVRDPVVAGQFYPGTGPSLAKEVASLVTEGTAKEDAIGVVSPHAGYMYSGVVAGAVLSSITPKNRYIILGPNHTGLGALYSLSDASFWKTPLGEVKIDEDLRNAILNRSSLIVSDAAAHMAEHSIEVQLPLLQVIQKNFKFVPIVIGSDDAGAYTAIGKEIADAVKDLGLAKEVAIIASSDMTHYESDDSARKKDKAAIDMILALDEEGLVTRVRKMGISMCGYAPVAVMISAAKALGANSARLVKYATSGDVSGDYSSVVGYAGIVVH
jgi:AmmeMemoRadiSam system protein B